MLIKVTVSAIQSIIQNFHFANNSCKNYIIFSKPLQILKVCAITSLSKLELTHGAPHQSEEQFESLGRYGTGCEVLVCIVKSNAAL
jgi:hypothetical protein